MIAIRRRGLALAAVATCVAPLAACAANPTSRARDSLLPVVTPSSVEVATAPVAGVGTVLVDGDGHTLYMFPPDARTRVSCVGPCAGTWPPLTIRAGKHPRATGAAQQAQLATLPDPNSGQDVVTYAGFPLYRYAGDVAAGTANGQALFSDHGPWYSVTASGEPVTVDPDEAR